MVLDQLLARCEFVGAARSSVGYCRAEGIDWTATAPATGGLYLARIAIEPPRRFRFEPRGIEAAVIEVIEADGETVGDLAAWPTDDPTTVLTMFGAPVLGSAWAANPSSFFSGDPLRLYRTPLSWLRAGAQGAVLLDRARGARWLVSDVDADLAAEDVSHAAELYAALAAAAKLNRIMVPDQDPVRAAA